MKRLCQWLLRWRYPLPLIVLGMILALPSLWLGLFADDFAIRSAVLDLRPDADWPGGPWEPFTFLNGNPEQNLLVVDRGYMPWWTDLEARAAFWRPLTAATHIVDYRLLDNYPALMHLHSMAWFALLIWATAMLYRRLMGETLPAWTAVLAALLFTVDDTHAAPGVWLANRNALLAGLFGVLTLIAHDRWRRDGWRPGAALGPLALLAAVLSKESAVATGAYLVAYAAFLDRASWKRRFAALLPCALTGIAWYLTYKALGFGVQRLGMYIEPTHNPIGFLEQLARNGPLLLLGQWGIPSADTTIALSPEAFRVQWLWAVVFLALLAVLLAPLIAHSRLAKFWTVGMILSVVPASMTFPSNRLLLFAGLGGCGLLAQWLAGIRTQAAWLPDRRIWRRPAQAAAYLLLALHLVLAPCVMPLSALALHLLSRSVAAAADSFPNDRAIEQQTLVLVNIPSWMGSSALIQMQPYLGRSTPQRILQLNASFRDAELDRLDATTIAVRPQGGYLVPRNGFPRSEDFPSSISIGRACQQFDGLTRRAEHPLRVGDRINLSVAQIEITRVTADGRPAEAVFHFRVPLEDPSLRWVCYTKRRFAPFAPPEVGQTVKISFPADQP